MYNFGHALLFCCMLLLTDSHLFIFWSHAILLRNILDIFQFYKWEIISLVYTLHTHTKIFEISVVPILIISYTHIRFLRENFILSLSLTHTHIFLLEWRHFFSLSHTCSFLSEAISFFLSLLHTNTHSFFEPGNFFPYLILSHTHTHTYPHSF